MEHVYTIQQIVDALQGKPIGYTPDQIIHYLELMLEDEMSLEDVIERLKSERDLFSESESIQGP